MAALARTLLASRSVNIVTNLFTNFSLSSNGHAKISLLRNFQRLQTSPAASFHSTPRQWDLMEFFDDEKNWGVSTVKSGRSWKLDELRIKSNEDLHKLWFVLLKERNMLMTMEHACKNNWQIFPNPERLDKVEDSMKNLEIVVRERNRAYHMLETGESGERPQIEVYDQIGMKRYHFTRQYAIPKFMNTKWKKNHIYKYGGYAVRKFLRRYREQIWIKKCRSINRETRLVRTYLKTFPNVDVELLKKRHPRVNFKRLLNSDKVRGHFLPK